MTGIVLVGSQWGDEGKGKATDLLGDRVDYVVKYNGGNNAGHSVEIKGEQYALHLLPSGVLSPNVTPVIGNGVVIDIRSLFEEIDLLISRGIDVRALRISANAHVTLKYHRLLDVTLENDKAKQKIGTTGRGIGPTYSDKISRCGVRISDLFHEDVLKEKITSALDSKNRIFFRYGLDEVSTDEVIAEIKPYLERLKPMVANTQLEINNALKQGKNVLFEGGQATMLDIDFGTYPFVTSSNATVGGAITGSGANPLALSSVIGVIKAYTTRVGEGPFPTELLLDDEIQSAFKNGKNSNTPDFSKPVDKLLSDSDFGYFLLKNGGEFGTTTGRPRRCGWFDSVVARHTSMINGVTDFVLTKLDVLTGIEKIKVCVAYDVDGEIVEDMPFDEVDFCKAKPVYKSFDGWNEDISSVRNFEDLPINAQKYIIALEELSNSRISVIGVGAERGAIIERYDVIH